MILAFLWLKGCFNLSNPVNYVVHKYYDNHKEDDYHYDEYETALRETILVRIFRKVVYDFLWALFSTSYIGLSP